MKTLIITADDFGNSLPINEAVEAGHREGVLSAASLMVGGPAFEDAVERARRLPRLGVGLHITLVDGKPVLPPEEIPGLVGTDGRFNVDATKQGVALFFSPTLRKQARREIRAQFARFQSTGLPLDHVNGHQHFHMHPVVVSELVAILPGLGAPPVRLPCEPFGASYRAIGDRAWHRFSTSLFFASQSAWLKRKMAAIGVRQNTRVFGLSDTGHMTRERMLRYLAALPEGTSEVYLHPATRRWEGSENLPAEYETVREYEALVDPAVKGAVAAQGLTSVSFQTAFGRA